MDILKKNILIKRYFDKKDNLFHLKIGILVPPKNIFNSHTVKNVGGKYPFIFLSEYLFIVILQYCVHGRPEGGGKGGSCPP